MTDIEHVDHQDATPVVSVPTDVPASWAAAMRLAGRIYDTPFVPKGMRGEPATVLACILAGEELGIGPMQSLQSIHVIEGRPAASPELMRALVCRAGHLFEVVDVTTTAVTVHGQRRDTGAEATFTWTIADAQRAGLAGKDVWKKYPRALLLARATSELCRAIFPDVVKGLSYTPEEASAIEGGVWEPAGELEPATPEPPAHIGPTDAQRRHAMALWGELGIKDRTQRLLDQSQIIGRDKLSFNDLTPAEVSKVIDTLIARKAEQGTRDAAGPTARVPVPVDALEDGDEPAIDTLYDQREEAER